MAVKLDGITVYGITMQDVELIKQHYLLRSSEIEKITGIKARYIGEVICALGLRKKYTKTKIPLDKISEWEKDLENPKISHAALGFKWDVTPEAIGHARRSRGHGVWRTNHNTVPEIKVQNILTSLNLSFIYQKRIDKWSIDFYLGHNICLDVHGRYFHTKELVLDRDERKKEWLKERGYFYLVLTEDEIEDVVNTTEKLDTFYWVSLKSNLKLKNFVNPIIQGCLSEERLTVNSREDNTVPSFRKIEGVETNCKSEDELPIEARNSYL